MTFNVMDFKSSENATRFVMRIVVWRSIEGFKLRVTPDGDILLHDPAGQDVRCDQPHESVKKQIRSIITPVRKPLGHAVRVARMMESKLPKPPDPIIAHWQRFCLERRA